MAKEYRSSAALLQERINALRLQSKETAELQREERLVLLQAEYYHLLRLAAYLENYYEEPAHQYAQPDWSAPEGSCLPA